MYSVFRVDSLRDFFNFFDKATKCLHFQPPMPKIEIESTKSKNNLFAHYYSNIIERPNRHFRLTFPFGNSSVFSIKKFELHENEIILTKNVNLNRREIHLFYNNRCYVANKCEKINSNYDVCCIHA